MKKQFLFSCTILILASCFSKKAIVKTNLPTPEKKVEAIAEIKKDVPVEAVKKEMPVELKNNLNPVAQGKALYQTKCNQCHDLKNEKSESERGWHHHVPEMVEMSNKAGKPITQAESDLILGYLLNAIRD
jgi:hypothetical protein